MTNAEDVTSYNSVVISVYTGNFQDMLWIVKDKNTIKNKGLLNYPMVGMVMTNCLSKLICSTDSDRKGVSKKPRR